MARTELDDRIQGVVTLMKGLSTRANIELLVEHGVGISVSIDGPKEVRDRGRIDMSGAGTFDTVMKNLELLNREYPDYCKDHLRAVSTYDWGTDLRAEIRGLRAGPGIWRQAVGT